MPARGRFVKHLAYFAILQKVNLIYNPTEVRCIAANMYGFFSGGRGNPPLRRRCIAVGLHRFPRAHNVRPYRNARFCRSIM